MSCVFQPVSAGLHHRLCPVKTCKKPNLYWEKRTWESSIRKDALLLSPTISNEGMSQDGKINKKNFLPMAVILRAPQKVLNITIISNGKGK